jgi:hypothetical protein
MSNNKLAIFGYNHWGHMVYDYTIVNSVEQAEEWFMDQIRGCESEGIIDGVNPCCTLKEWVEEYGGHFSTVIFDLPDEVVMNEDYDDEYLLSKWYKEEVKKFGEKEKKKKEQQTKRDLRRYNELKEKLSEQGVI